MKTIKIVWSRYLNDTGNILPFFTSFHPVPESEDGQKVFNEAILKLLLQYNMNEDYIVGHDLNPEYEHSECL